MNAVTRRRFLGGAAATAAGAAMGPWVLRAHAQSGPLKVGLVLPYTGAYAVLGESITQGMELVFARENWTVAGRKVEMIKEDDDAAVHGAGEDVDLVRVDQLLRPRAQRHPPRHA